MAIYTILANDRTRRIRIVPTETADGRWTYRVTELDGTELDDEPHFQPTASRDQCERYIETGYSDPVWDLQVEG